MDTEDVRLAVYRSFAQTGRAPELGSLAGGALRKLHEQRHVVLDRDGRIVMADPFAAVPLGFSVMGRETLWWGGCAWDSFALPHLLPRESEVLVATQCPGCRAALAWVVNRDTPPAGAEVAHFLMPASRMWEDVVHTCGHQRLFCGEQCVSAWLQRTGHQRGYVMDLATLWRLAQGWYAGRLDHGYQRREPSQAKEYFRSVGLRGPFWGL
ncbi:MAG: organomercurial lyase [Solirubrobacteraceae bacterium]